MPKSLAIFYSTGGLGDVGRHAIRAALDQKGVGNIKVLTQHEETLKEPNWNCGCPGPHEFNKEEMERLEIVTVQDWSADEIAPHLEGVSGVVSCLGNRQPFWGDRVGKEGTEGIVEALKNDKDGTKRVICISSVGINEDWPPIEWVWVGKVLKWIFLTIGRREYNDLKGVEDALTESDLDYLIVRPVAIGEDIVPVNKWFLQKEKYKDTLNYNLAKLDAARFMVQEALEPTLHRKAVVIGSNPDAETL